MGRCSSATRCVPGTRYGSHRAQLMSHGFNVSDAAAMSSLDAIERIDAEALLPGHGEPWRDGVSAAVTEARARV